MVEDEGQVVPHRKACRMPRSGHVAMGVYYDDEDRSLPVQITASPRADIDMIFNRMESWFYSRHKLEKKGQARRCACASNVCTPTPGLERHFHGIV